MDWADQPPTWKQVKFLKDHGYVPDRRLTKTEAEELIRKLGGNLEPAAAAANAQLPSPAALPPAAYQLRVKADKARRTLEDAGRTGAEKLEHALATARAERQCFWIATCLPAGRELAPSVEIDQLYQKHGCRFEPPGRKEVQFILDALDLAMPFWDRDHPELFYQTLELNFPALVRRLVR